MAQYTTTDDIQLGVEANEEVIYPVKFFKSGVLYSITRIIPDNFSAHIHFLPNEGKFIQVRCYIHACIHGLAFSVCRGERYFNASNKASELHSVCS